MLLLLVLTLLLGFVARDIEAHNTCTSAQFGNTDDLPPCFHRTICKGHGHQLSNSLNAFHQVTTQGIYRYYGLNYNKLTVSVNGYLKFGWGSLAPVYSWLTAGKPYRQVYDLVAAYWAYTDTRWCGKVCYRETTKKKALVKFRRNIEAAFKGTSGFGGFNPTHVFSVTYFNVDSVWNPCCRPTFGKRDAEEETDAYLRDEREEPDDEEDSAPGEVDNPAQNHTGKADDGDRESSADGEAADPPVNGSAPGTKSSSFHGLNSYQIVLGTNGKHTYVILKYAKVEWVDSNRQMAGFWTNWWSMKWTYAFRWSWTTLTYWLRFYGHIRFHDCKEYKFRVDEFSWPFIRDPNAGLSQFAYFWTWP